MVGAITSGGRKPPLFCAVKEKDRVNIRICFYHLGKSAEDSMRTITGSLECMRGYKSREGKLPNVDFTELVRTLRVVRSGADYALEILEELGVIT